MKHSSLLYHILKPFIRLLLKIFFRRIEVQGLENVPQDAPVLFTPNHQSAFMDAIVVACAVPQAVHSVTRALVFESPPVAWILRKLNMMPIYRIRNGIQNLSKNEATFDHCVELLQHKESVLIFPEGSQNVIKKVRSLSKGFSRIVFRAEEIRDFQMELQIIPVGLNYGQTTQFRGDLYIRFGEPMQVKDLKESYTEQPQKAMNSLRKTLQKCLEKEVVHIEEKTFYETFRYLTIDFLPAIFDYQNTANQNSEPISRLQKNKNENLTSLFHLQKESLQKLTRLAEENPHEMQTLAEKIQTYRGLLKETKLDSSVFVKQKNAPTFAKKIKVVLLAPIGIYTYFNHYLACKIPQLLTYKLFKDPSFFASMKLGFGLFFFLLFYALQTLLVGLLAQSGGIAALYLLSLIVSGWIALQLETPLQKWRLQHRKNSIQKNKPLKWKKLETLFEEIKSSIGIV